VTHISTCYDPRGDICICSYIHIHIHTYIYVCMYTYIYTCIHLLRRIQGDLYSTGWRRPMGCLKLLVIFCKRATSYRALLRKMTYKDKAFHASTPPCTCFRYFTCKITKKKITPRDPDSPGTVQVSFFFYNAYPV